MRLKSSIWVMAFLRQCASAGATAVVARKGQESAGAVFIKVIRRDRRVALFGPAPAGQESPDGDRLFCACLKEDWLPEADADAYIERQGRFDPDFWLVEVEDREGRHFLGGRLTVP
ncbi:MAG: DUF1491 family protein [Hyphomicrobiales bacterium]